MSISPIELLMFVFAFVPGYIFVHTLDYSLIKGEKSQFEKTIQVILASTSVWIVFVVLPPIPLISIEKEELIKLLIAQINANNIDLTTYLLRDSNFNKLCLSFISICIYVFMIALFFSVVRRARLINNIIIKIFKRDWYKTVSLRFFHENFGQTFKITMKNEKKYVGNLIGAPDGSKDSYIIINDPYIVKDDDVEKLVAYSLLVSINDIELIEAIKNDYKRESIISRTRDYISTTAHKILRNKKK